MTKRCKTKTARIKKEREIERRAKNKEKNDRVKDEKGEEIKRWKGK